MENAPIPARPFGKAGFSVSAVGLGGEGVLRTFGREEAAEAVIEEALDQNITYFDSARAYSGSESYYGQVWYRKPEARNRIFQTSKSAMRDKKGALADLHRTLANMKTDHLDLWQIHDVRTREDLEEISGPGGALEAFVEAKAGGKTRFIGVTGHHDPSILLQAVKEWPVDSVLMPVNPAEAAMGGFMSEVLPAARDKGLAVIGMKVLGGGNYIIPGAGIDAERLIRFALAQPVTLVIVGCSTPLHVRTLASVARPNENGDPAVQDREELVGLFAPHAERLAYYRGWK